MATAEFAPTATDATESDSQALGVGVATPEKALSDAESDSPALSVDVATPEVTLSGPAAPRRTLAKRQSLLTRFKALPGYAEAKKFSSLTDLSNWPDLPDLLPETPNPDQSKRSWEREVRLWRLGVRAWEAWLDPSKTFPTKGANKITQHYRNKHALRARHRRGGRNCKRPRASASPGESATPGESANPGELASPDESASPGESASPCKNKQD